MNLSIERKLWEQGYKLIAGVDEAGRGPLAGPVVAAVVILPSSVVRIPSLVKEINDSKKLSAKKREELFIKIKKDAVCVGVGISSREEIDEINILQATLLAMRRAVENLKKKPDYIIVDGKQVPFISSFTIPQRSIVRGDSCCSSIAAASIIAKVTRDRLMMQFALRYPQYKFEKHKGYPTKEHIRILREFGPCEIHRRSFGPVKKQMLDARCQKK